MKRLLLPLLAAIVIPTAVNAFPFGNKTDIIRKTLAGETIIVKKENTIQNVLNYFDLKSEYKEAVPFIENEVKTQNKRSLKLSGFYSCGYDGDLSQQYCEKKYSVDGLKTIAEELKNHQTLINRKTATFTNSDEIHLLEITYQPILKTLNGGKAPMEVSKTKCINPNIEEEAFNAWNDLYMYWYQTELKNHVARNQKKQLDKLVCNQAFAL